MLSSCARSFICAPGAFALLESYAKHGLLNASLMRDDESRVATNGLELRIGEFAWGIA